MSESIKNLSKSCRACLRESKDMFLVTQDQKETLEMFNSISKTEWVQEGDFPEYLCEKCKESLKAAYSFQQLCQKSHLKILKSLSKENVKVEHEHQFKDENETDCEDNFSEIENNDLQENSDSSVDFKEETKPCRTSRLKIVSVKLVNEAIKEFKVKINQEFNCCLCNYNGKTIRLLSSHIGMVHKEFKSSWCMVCNKIIPENLSEHKKIHNYFKETCKFCSKTLKRGHYVEHLRAHSGSRPFRCKICNTNLTNRSSLRVHLRVHKNIRPYICKLCSKEFVTVGLYNSHMKISHDLKNKCEDCDVFYQTQTELENHDCVKNEEEPDGVSVNEIEFSEITEEPLDGTFKEQKNVDLDKKLGIMPEFDENTSAELHNFCKICDKRVRSLDKHLKTCHGDSNVSENENEEHRCDVCNKSYKTFNRLRTHLRLHTKDSPFKCKICGQSARNKRQLADHERTHTKEKPFICCVCGKCFSQAGSLRTHMKQHTGKPEECHLCEKRFCRKSELRLHLQKHAGEKPFLCPHCGKTFSQRSHLTDHAKSHSEERPFQCPYCEKSFKKDAIFKAHVQIHLGIKRYKCELCSYACNKSYRLSQHVKQHLEEKESTKTYSCPVCEKTFKTISIYQMHMVAIHNAVL